MLKLSRILRQRSALAGYRHTWDLGALAAGATAQFNEDNAHIRPGLTARPDYNGITVVNNSDVDVYADLDYSPSRRIVVLAHSAQTIENLVPYLTLNVTNSSTTTAITAGQVYVTVKYERDVLREAA